LNPASLVTKLEAEPCLSCEPLQHSPGLDPITEEEKLEIKNFNAEGEREARVFAPRLNSLDAQPAVNPLFNNLRDGNVLLQAYNKIIPNSVN
jgi:plastin-1